MGRSPTALAWDRLEADIGKEKNKAVLRDVKHALQVLRQEVRESYQPHARKPGSMMDYDAVGHDGKMGTRLARRRSPQPSRMLEAGGR